MGSGVRVIAISDFVANYVRTVFKAPEERIRMIHRCVDLVRFNPDFVTPDRLIRMTERWRAPDGATVILLPGRLTRWKGHRVLIEAIAELKNPDIFVIIQGSDQGRHKYRNELLALIRKLQMQLMYLGLESLYQDQASEREFGSLTMSLTEKEFEEIKFKLRQMRKALHKENSIARMTEKGDRVYQLNLQLFPVSNASKKFDA